MALEIERKFRVTSDAWRQQARERRLLQQGYLANTPRASVRVRLDGQEGLLSVKAMRSGMSRDEYEVGIAFSDAREMLERLCEGFVIRKWRHLIDFAGHTWEVDEFLDENAGLVIAELELPAEDAHFDRPTWVGAEITDEERFYNVRLAQKPYRHWPENLLASRGGP